MHSLPFVFVSLVSLVDLDEVDNQEVQGIEDVEEILCPGTLDETTLAVIHIDGDEGQTGNPTHGEHDAADGCLKDTVATQHIEQNDERHPTGAIVSMHQDACCYEPKQPHGQLTIPFGGICFCLAVRLPTTDGTQSEKPQEQRKEHILP